jgi:hypothetical protein
MKERGAAEARLLHVERGIESLDGIVRALRRRAIALGQGVWAEWGDVSMVSQSTCTATFTGSLLGCGGAGVVGQTLTVKSSGGMALSSVTTESGGAFSGSVSITSPSDLVTLTCSATNYEPFSTTATLTCGSNSLGYLTMTPIVTAAPTINTIASIVVCGGSGGTVSLSGITDGNRGSALPITVSATSTNTSIIPNPSITYTSPNAAGTLTYTITGTPTNTATISVKVTNSGSTFCSGVTTKVKTFSIQVKQPSTPTLNPISNPAPVLVLKQA